MKHWTTKTIGEVCQFSNGLWKGEKPPFVNVGVIRNTNFTKDGTLDDSDIAYLDVEAKKFEKRHLKSGDIILEKSGGGPKQPVGRVVLFDKTEGLFSFSNFTAALRILDAQELDSRFLHKFLHWTYLSGITERMQSNSTGIRNLDSDAYKSIQITFPSLAEQERIVKLLDEADELRNLRAQADRRTTVLIPALFQEIFGDPIKNPKGWEVCSFAEVGKLDRGRSKNRPRDEPSLYGGTYPFIQTGDVANSNGEIITHTQTYSEKGLAQSRMWPTGTLVITIAANIGKTAILTFPACFPDSMVGFIPGDRVIVDYVRPWLVTMESRLEEAAPQMAQKNINLKILRELTIPVPPLALQKEFAKRVTEIRELEASQATSRTHLDALFQSMLHRAFNSNL